MFENDTWWGGDSQGRLQDLQKALTTGATFGLTDQTGGGAVRLESLQSTLKSLTFKMSNELVFWNKLAKKKAWSTVEEYVREYEVGDANFYSEGGLPEEGDSVMKREYEIVRFLGVVGKISNPALAVRNIMDLRANEVVNRTKALLRRVEKTIPFGQNSVNSYEFNGLLYDAVTYGPAENVIDMQGKRVRPQDFNTAARIIRDNYGIPTDIFLSPLAKEYYLAELLASKTYFLNQQSTPAIGLNPSQAVTGHGTLTFNDSVFLNTSDPGVNYYNQAGTQIKVSGQPPSAAVGAKVPNTPTIGTPTSPADSASVFLSGDAATYDYKVTAINAFGESAAVASTGIAVVAGDKVVLPVTEGGGAYTATGYRAYRKLSTESTYKYCFQVAYSAATQNVEDYNLYRHGTSMSFVMDMSEDVIAMHQLLPYFSEPLAKIDDSIRWLQKIYITKILYNPKKLVVIKNIGATAHS